MAKKSVNSVETVSVETVEIVASAENIAEDTFTEVDVESAILQIKASLGRCTVGQLATLFGTSQLQMSNFIKANLPAWTPVVKVGLIKNYVKPTDRPEVKKEKTPEQLAARAKREAEAKKRADQLAAIGLVPRPIKR